MISLLYVDDEADLLELGKLVLEKGGQFSVSTYTSASDALASLKSMHYDAIIADYRMPGMNGIEFLQAIRESGRSTPFIIFTGKGDQDTAILALNAGADYYLKKGGDTISLFSELGKVVRTRVLQKQAVLDLADQEQRYLDIRNANDLIQSVTPDGHFLFVNKKWQDTLGYGEHELAGITLFDIIHEESKEHCMDLFPRVLAGENVGIIDAVFKTRNGRKIFVEGMANCKIVDGKPQYTRGIFKDVTDRKLAEKALRDSEERFRNLFENANEAIFVIQDGRICFANPKIMEIGGYEKDELAAKPFLEFVHPADRALVGEQHVRRLKGERLKETYAFRILPKDGSVRWMEINAGLITWDNRPAVLVFLSDITERKRTEEALYRANEKLNILSSITRHDILNQLNVLLGYLRLLKEDAKGAEMLRFLEKEESAAMAIQRQIEFTRAYQDIGVKAPEWMDVAHKIGSAFGQLHPAGITLQNSVTGLEIFVDSLVEKVFYNLIENSIRHGEHVTAIWFSAEETEKGLILRYRDNGIGIPEQDKKKLFQKEFGKNTGLGLFLSREILSITGITITENGEPGEGARFDMLVPKGAYRHIG